MNKSTHLKIPVTFVWYFCINKIIVKIISGKGLSVINITGSKNKIKDLSLVVDNKMKLKPKEPEYCNVPF
jgi:hypothetical protein